jgi:hypothetical protein
MMAGPVDAILKLSVTVSLLGAAASVGYLPTRDAKLDNERRLEMAHAEIARKVAEERADAGRLAVEQRQAQEQPFKQVMIRASTA